MHPSTGKLRDSDYVRLAEFRYAMRRFLAFSEEAARTAGLTPRQHQALLSIRGWPDGPPNIAELAGRLLVRHHTAAGLVNRLAAMHLVRRTPSLEDRRMVRLTLTREGSRLLETLSLAHRAELRTWSPRILAVLESINHSTDHTGPPPR